MTFKTASLTLAAFKVLSPCTLVSKLVAGAERIFSIMTSSERPNETSCTTSSFESGFCRVCAMARLDKSEQRRRMHANSCRITHLKPMRFLKKMPSEGEGVRKRPEREHGYYASRGANVNFQTSKERYHCLGILF